MRALLLSVSLAGVVLAAAVAHAQDDRYGPDRASDPADQTVASLDGPYLSWPGKQAPASDAPALAQPPSDEAAPPPPAPPPQVQTEPPAPGPEAVAAQPAIASLPAELPAPAQPIPPASAVQPAAPERAAAAAAAQPPAQAEAATAAPRQTAEDAGHARLPPHIYSVARDYGLRPDPIPLPQQFFTDQGSPDIAQPPGPLPPRPVPGPQTVNNPNSANTPSNRARAIAQDLPDPDTADPTD